MPKISVRSLHQQQPKTIPLVNRSGSKNANDTTSSKSAASASTSAARYHGPMLNKDLGQHILKNPLVVSGIIDKANILSSDTVLEIGPGTGNMTVRMLQDAKKVIAVEFDPRMAAELSKRVNGTPEQRRLQIIVGDFLKVQLPYFDLCISNTPYQISAPLMEKLLRHRPQFRAALLMFQREFAMRLVAQPGDPLYCRLSVNTQLYAKVTHVMKVGKNNFRPPPKVESSVVKVEPIQPPPPVPFEEFDGLVRICFGRKNKLLIGNFKTDTVLGILEANYKTWRAQQQSEDCMEEDIDMKKMVTEVLESVGMSNQRASKMDVDDYLKLLHAFHGRGIHFA